MNILKGTKAEVLKKMQEARFPVPENMYFNVTKMFNQIEW